MKLKCNVEGCKRIRNELGLCCNVHQEAMKLWAERRIDKTVDAQSFIDVMNMKDKRK
jgi:hypothetical protein